MGEGSVTSESSILPNTWRKPPPPQQQPTSLIYRRGNHLPALFFLLGSILILWRAIWNYVDPQKGSSALEFRIDDNNKQSDLNANNEEEDYWSRGWIIYSILSVLGPFMYVLNGVSDWFVAIQGNSKCCNGQVLAAVVFTLAATLDIIATAIYTPSAAVRLTAKKEVIILSYTLHSLAKHCYVVYALAALYWKRYEHYGAQEARTVNRLGDTLFLLGSFIDVIISYVTRPNANPDWREVERWALVSASFWFVNALFFILATIMERRHARAIAKATSTSATTISFAPSTPKQLASPKQIHPQQNTDVMSVLSGSLGSHSIS